MNFHVFIFIDHELKADDLLQTIGNEVIVVQI